MPISGSYSVPLVALSIVIAIFASYAALDLAGRVTASKGKIRLAWLLGGAVAMGLGIWAMHYIGMLAFRMPMRVSYDPATVLASLLAAVAASLVALFTVSREQMGRWQTAAGGIVMGSGIAAMHYIGMAAMRMQARTEYDPLLLAASIVLAIAISMIALTFAFSGRDEKKASPRKLINALIMGSAIPVMHYTGMIAARFVPSDAPIDFSHAASISSIGTTAIAATSLLVLSLVIVTSFLDRLLSAQMAAADSARAGEIYFRTMADAIPQIIWTALPSGRVDFYNKRWYDYAGLTPSPNADQEWQNVVHADDLQACIEKWQEALKLGEPYEGELRLLRASDKAFRWHLTRAVPLRQGNRTITKWFGTSTDIEDQKRNQQTLEEQVQQRTEALVEANTRLTERSQKSSLLAQMGELLQSCANLKEAFSVFVGFAPKMFPNLRGAVILLNSSRSLLEVVGSWADCELSSSVFEPSSCWALRTGHRYQVEGAGRGVPCAHSKNLSGASLCIPIQAHGESLGVIHFQTMESAGKISELELSLAGPFAEQAGLAVANIRLREALRSQSIRDGLTGLFNRRYLEETLEREVHRAARTAQSLGVIMLDMDHFKSFNDNFGHEAGDLLLHEFGVFLSRHTRADDIACRYGGEEFALIFPGADLENTRRRAEHMQTAVRDIQLIHQGRPLGPITLSAGVAVMPLHGTSPRQLLAAADAALYKAKRGGRDRVMVADSAADSAQAGSVSAGASI
jgi:diguanylate cyclase (GGDEF)-like protein/PAS domain S-box-containing protein